MILASTGAAAIKQWDRMGTFTETGQRLHGRLVYKHQQHQQHIFYIYGQFDGWLVGKHRAVGPSLQLSDDRVWQGPSLTSTSVV